MEANDNYERDFGWPRSELIGRTSVEVGIWPDQATRAPWVEAIRREGRLVNYETVWMHKNGERRNVSLSAEITELNGKTCILAYSTDITARKRAEQALVSSETRLRAVLNGVQSGVVTITENGIVESFNQSAEKMFGYGAGEVVGRNVSMLMPEPYKAAHDGYLGDYLSTGIQKVIGQSRNVVARRKDGTTFPIELGVTETFLNETRFFIGSVSDISFRRRAEAELRIAATAFESQEGMVVTDPAGVILRINKAFTDISGYTAEEVVGQTPRLLKSGRHDDAFYVAMWASLASTGAWQGEVWDRRKNGEVYPKWLTISAVKGDDGVVTHYVGTHQDITERKKAEERIKELAFFDSLTHLPNRTLLLDRLKQAMTAGNRSGTFGAVLFIDLDHFKTLNDTLGHDKGDMLLQQVAQRLAASVREGDTVARLGGDEFVVVLGSLNKTAEEAANETEVVGEKILAVLNQTYPLGDIDYRSSASIGATLFRGHETSIEDLLKQADLAMYKSKTSGRNGLHFFDPAMQTVVVERVALETGLRKAIEGNQLLLHFQPQVVGVGRVTGAEALVRWQHPERGMVSPAEFIPLAEETGLILPLGQWVLERACTQLALWAIHPDMAHLTVAVNVSAQEFRDADFVLKVVAILNQTGANPNRLKLELTESLLVDNVEDVIDKMSALKARGVGFSLDDFGTGYSSLSYLKRLPLDQLKIDQSFVRDILIDPNDAAIARTIVALAQSLGLDVIAEGVETETQRAFLASSGCHAYQGYFFSRPLPVAGFEEFVRRV
jgi:diguanylate cyclase (GGDEF)-like protein/PAS domain S-box-containing protein